MEEETHFLDFVEVLQSSIKILEKNKLRDKDLTKKFKFFKFKVLNNRNRMSLKNMMKDESRREILKSLYLINLEENLDNCNLNRSNFNLLNLLKLHIKKCQSENIPNEPTLRTTYNPTLGITLLYNLYKIKSLS